MKHPNKYKKTKLDGNPRTKNGSIIFNVIFNDPKKKRKRRIIL